jgi:SAM-dependent methyltransferase
VHSIRNSLTKRLYTWTLSSAECARRWGQQYWHEEDGLRVVACRNCPKFDPAAAACTVPFGSPIRKCVTAAQEANLHSLNGLDLLEIGVGKHSIPRRLVTSAGGTWTGIEPMLPRSKAAKFGRGGFGHVAAIPFPDASFDFVTGIQSIEHWGEPLPDPDLESDHAKGLAEVFRVLRPGGRIYFCAPLHLHGHEMFIAGDIDRIRGLFAPQPWEDLVIELWRTQHEPLDRFVAPDADYQTWGRAVTSYPNEVLDEIRAHRSVALVTIKARKSNP